MSKQLAMQVSFAKLLITRSRLQAGQRMILPGCTDKQTTHRHTGNASGGLNPLIRWAKAYKI